MLYQAICIHFQSISIIPSRITSEINIIIIQICIFNQSSSRIPKICDLHSFDLYKNRSCSWVSHLKHYASRTTVRYGICNATSNVRKLRTILIRFDVNETHICEWNTYFKLSFHFSDYKTICALGKYERIFHVKIMIFKFMLKSHITIFVFKDLHAKQYKNISKVPQNLPKNHAWY